MKTLIVTILGAVSMAFTAYASLPPNSGLPDWNEINVTPSSAPQNGRSACDVSMTNAKDVLSMLIAKNATVQAKGPLLTILRQPS